MSLTEKRRIILQECEANGTITKKQLVEKYNYWYYCNEDKHIGDVLSRMVNAGLLERVKPGVFKIGSGKRQTAAGMIDNNQKDLFK